MGLVAIFHNLDTFMADYIHGRSFSDVGKYYLTGKITSRDRWIANGFDGEPCTLVGVQSPDRVSVLDNHCTPLNVSDNSISSYSDQSKKLRESFPVLSNDVRNCRIYNDGCWMVPREPSSPLAHRMPVRCLRPCVFRLWIQLDPSLERRTLVVRSFFPCPRFSPLAF